MFQLLHKYSSFSFIPVVADDICYMTFLYGVYEFLSHIQNLCKLYCRELRGKLKIHISLSTVPNSQKTIRN